MKGKDINKIAAVEKAIAEKYGAETIINPRANWDSAKEEEYKRQIKEFHSKKRDTEIKKEKIDLDGIKVSKKLLSRDSKKACPVCTTVPKFAMDDVCIVKYECCYRCYERYVDGREERWLSGWRPNLEKNENI